MSTLFAFLYAILMAALPPCPTEDSNDCSWDASTMGNGRGTSFVSVAIPDGADGSDLVIFADGSFKVVPSA